MSEDLYIFDLDGTLSLAGHRQHLLTDRKDPECWRRFYAASINDKPNWPVIGILKAVVNSGAEFLIFSGRSDEVRTQTVHWLRRHISGLSSMAIKEVLQMRKTGDFTPDHELKKRWYEEMDPSDQARIAAVFEDRDRVVEMWRELGLTCFQVAPGDF